MKTTLLNELDPTHPKRIDGYFSETIFTDPIEIIAPLELVWAVIVDFQAYAVWNPLNRFFQLDSAAEPGGTITFGVSWGPYQKNGLVVPVSELKTDLTQHEKLTLWEPDCCLAYADDFGQWHKAERVQYISRLANGNTSYHTYERMAGLITPLIRFMYRKKIQAGLTAAGAALKTRAETLAKTN